MTHRNDESNGIRSNHRRESKLTTMSPMTATITSSPGIRLISPHQRRPVGAVSIGQSQPHTNQLQNQQESLDRHHQEEKHRNNGIKVTTTTAGHEKFDSGAAKASAATTTSYHHSYEKQQQLSLDDHHQLSIPQSPSDSVKKQCHNDTSSRKSAPNNLDDHDNKKRLLLHRDWKMNVNGIRWNNRKHSDNCCQRLLLSIASSSDNSNSNNEKGSSSTSFCESSLSLNCSCKRIPMIAFLLLIIFVFLFCNISLFVQVNTHLLDLMYPSEYDNDNLENKKFLSKVGKSHSERRKEYFGKKRLSFYGADADGGTRKQKVKREPIVPNRNSLLKNATFSACLLIKDDNDILNEWIAYHYHTVHLRQLIVAVDPTSTESPTKILDKWRNVTSLMTPKFNSDGVKNDLMIVEWYDEDYMPDDFLKTGKAPIIISNASDLTNIADAHNPELQNETILLQISNHRYRQRVFLAQCLREFRFYYNLSWVVHIDTDEYIVASKLLRQMKPIYVDVPNSTEPSGGVLRLIQQTVARTYHLVGYPCISMLRVLFGSVESTLEEIFDQVPILFNASNFETLRWRYHALPHNMTLHGNPKVILDVSAIPEDYFPQNIVYSIHRPVKEVCPKNKEIAYTNFRKQPIGTNHYLGSWERYNARNDKRRSRSVYDSKASVKRGKDDFAGTWLKGFVANVGDAVAAQLLDSRYIVMTNNDQDQKNNATIATAEAAIMASTTVAVIADEKEQNSKQDGIAVNKHHDDDHRIEELKQNDENRVDSAAVDGEVESDQVDKNPNDDSDSQDIAQVSNDGIAEQDEDGDDDNAEENEIEQEEQEGGGLDSPEMDNDHESTKGQEEVLNSPDIDPNDDKQSSMQEQELDEEDEEEDEPQQAFNNLFIQSEQQLEGINIEDPEVE